MGSSQWKRRLFQYVLVALGAIGCSVGLSGLAADASAPAYQIEERVAYQNDNHENFWWAHMGCAALPNGATPQILCTLLKDIKESPTNLSDVVYEISSITSDDLGETWTAPAVIPQFQWKTVPDGYQGMLIDTVPMYHEKSGKLILLGMAQSYTSTYAKKHTYPAYAVYDPATATWGSDWHVFGWPNGVGHSGSAYPYMTEDGSGDILWPINSVDGLGSVQVVRASFDGTSLTYVSQGNAVPSPGSNGNRSGIETSLAKFGSEYFMTLRDDTQNRLAKSSDGINWQPAVVLTWDDGTPVSGSMNTQMHWITQPDALYVVYTREDASNASIYRYRAPLWMAKIDPVTLRLIKSTERVAMGITDNRAQLGNFGTYNVMPGLSIVSSNEWNSLFPNRAIVSRIWWDRLTVGSWQLDEASGSVAADSASGAYPGTIVGATREADGKFGRALRFDGNGDFVTLGDPADGSFDFGTAHDFSLSAWVKTSTTGKTQFIASKGDTNGAYWLRFETDNTIRFLLDYGSTYDAAQSTAAYADGKWHHVVGVADRDAGLRLYVDGVLAGQDNALTGGNVSSALPLTIGHASTLAMNGLIDGVSLYNYAIGDWEIARMFGEYGHWTFDESAGSVAADSTAFAYDGSVSNAVWSAGGKYGNALGFDGNGDYVTLPNPFYHDAAFGRTDNFSISMWVKTGVTGTTKFLMQKGDTNAGFWLRFESDNTIRFLLDYGSTYDAAQSAAAYADGAWHHVAAVVDRSAGIRLYVDGVLAGQDTSLQQGSIASALPLTVGVNGTNTMNGLIDDVRIYRYALTPSDIAALQ
ncbi:LamG domain-containing protein [Paenibacillus sp. MBLB4367]|uniref:LamG domain-containing protein n=1 Tax=Paenibacillus sp. MBLB4367 TaxID=3384767 RepID=UPI003907E7E3